MKIKTKLDGDMCIESYSIGGDPNKEVACKAGLNMWFDMKRRGKYIKEATFVLTKRRTEQSYKVSTVDTYMKRLLVRDSDGFDHAIAVFRNLYNAVEKMGGECYLAVEG